jgi:hypothetical protein
MSADVLPREWTADDLDGFTEREQQIFYWGMGVGWQECAETRDTAVIFNAGYLAASQRQIVDLTPKPATPRRPRHLHSVPS